jgi:hypothetical protein
MTSITHDGERLHLKMRMHCWANSDSVSIVASGFHGELSWNLVRYCPEYAAAFFVLGRSLKDAVNVCVKQLQDFQLAVALARIVENGDDGPVLKELLLNTVVPTAFKDGNRWLACWAFWKLHRRDLSVRVLLVRPYLWSVVERLVLMRHL